MNGDSQARMDLDQMGLGAPRCGTSKRSAIRMPRAAPPVGSRVTGVPPPSIARQTRGVSPPARMLAAIEGPEHRGVYECGS